MQASAPGQDQRSSSGLRSVVRSIDREMLVSLAAPTWSSRRSRAAAHSRDPFRDFAGEFRCSPSHTPFETFRNGSRVSLRSPGMTGCAALNAYQVALAQQLGGSASQSRMTGCEEPERRERHPGAEGIRDPLAAASSIPAGSR